jgi:hypothetical protein
MRERRASPVEGYDQESQNFACVVSVAAGLRLERILITSKIKVPNSCSYAT